MGRLDKRIETLEKLYADSLPKEPEDAARRRQARREIMFAILDEIQHLKGCRARGYRGGVPIQPTDPTGEALGYPYTHGQATEFAVKRAVARLGFSPDSKAAEELVITWVARLRSISEGRWDEVEAEAPPKPTPPWR